MDDVQLSEHLQAAQRAERNRDYAAASNQYEEILKINPDQALIWQSLAITYHLSNRYPEAISAFHHALTLDSKLWGAWLFLGMDYYKTNQFASAIPPLENAITLNAKMAEPEARFWLGSTYAALNRAENAVRELRRDLELRPKDVDVLYSLTRAYDQSAGFVFERLGQIDPNAGAVHILQAERFLEENKPDLAKIEYRRAIQVRPDFAGWIASLSGETASPPAPNVQISPFDARTNRELAALSTGATHNKAESENMLRGLELMRLGHFREAQPLLAGAAANNKNPYLKLSLIRSYSETGDCLTAERELRKFLEKDPKNVDALHLLGSNYRHLAETTLAQMVEIDADAYGVHELLGRQHEERTEFALAIQEYKTALAKRPDAGGLRYAIGNVYRKTSQYDQAEQWLSEEIKRNPYHGLAQYRLGSVYLEQGRAEEAIPHLEQALRANPKLMDARLDLGRAYTAAKRYPEAITALKQVVASEPNNDRVHYLLAAAYAREGNREQAQAEMALYQRLTRNRLQQTQQDIRGLSNSLERP